MAVSKSLKKSMLDAFLYVPFGSKWTKKAHCVKRHSEFKLCTSMEDLLMPLYKDLLIPLYEGLSMPVGEGLCMPFFGGFPVVIYPV